MGKDLKGKELGKGITQRKDGRYQARFTDRFGKRRCVYGVTLKEVKNALMTEVVDDYSKNNVADPNMTLDQWYEKWMRIYKEPTVKETTLIMIKSIYKNQFQEKLGKLPLNQITNIIVTDLFITINKKYSKNMVKNIRYVLFDMFDYAVINELCVKNPVKGVKLSGTGKKHIKALSHQEQQEFFEMAKENFYYNFFIVAINTGLRSGELRALTLQDIDLKNNIINVNKTLVYFTSDETGDTRYKLQTPKTKCSNRQVPMNSICRKAIIRQIELRKSLQQIPSEYSDTIGDILFVTSKNTPINCVYLTFSIRSIINKINKKRKQNDQELMPYFSTHTFRHTFATRCFEAGISPKTVQSYLGHASLQMTMDIYTDVLLDKKIKDIELLENVMSDIAI